jgi:hypothetical protein
VAVAARAEVLEAVQVAVLAEAPVAALAQAAALD